MRKDMRAYFQRLWDEGRAPKKWGTGASDIIKREYYEIMYDLHPHLSLAENNYKAEMLAVLSYPGWIDHKELEVNDDDDDDDATEKEKRKKQAKRDRKEREKQKKRDKAKEKRRKNKSHGKHTRGMIVLTVCAG